MLLFDLPPGRAPVHPLPRRLTKTPTRRYADTLSLLLEMENFSGTGGVARGWLDCPQADTPIHFSPRLDAVNPIRLRVPLPAA
jgi:hypothetical protein